MSLITKKKKMKIEMASNWSPIQKHGLIGIYLFWP